VAERLTGRTSRGEGIALAIALSLPVIGFALLLARPELDLHWQHQPSHFWLVLLTAAASVALAFATNEAAARRADARIVLVSLAFLVSAGFLGLHALATPGVLLAAPNAGFTVATPVGLAIASIFAAASATPLAGPNATLVLRHRTALRMAVLALLGGWAAVSLLGLPPLSGSPPEEANEAGAAFALVTMGLYAYAAWRYLDIGLRRASRFAITVAVALVLLAQSMLAVAFSRSWHLSWWEWHVLMTLAFGLIALGARAEYRRTRSLVATFEPIYLEATLDRIDRWHGRAIADLAAAEGRGESTERLLSDLRREGASSDELALMAQAAREIRRVDELFQPYLPQPYADRLRTDGHELGGAERTVTVLFADLAGFTTYSESHEPVDVIRMLNAFWAAVVPVIDDAGGAIEHFAGDGVLVLFNAVADLPDHAERAVRCALEIVRITDAISAERGTWPRFRVGVNTGTAAVGTVGAAGRRSFATVGDTTNLGSRLSGLGEPGQVVIGAATRDALASGGGAADLALIALGDVRVKGKRDPIAAWRVAYGSAL
jgi:class 3 adenylate cyclase